MKRICLFWNYTLGVYFPMLDLLPETIFERLVVQEWNRLPWFPKRSCKLNLNQYSSK